MILKNVNEKIMFSLKNKEKENVLILKGLKSVLLNNEKEKKPINEIDVLLSYYNSILKSRSQYKDLSRIEKIDIELNVLAQFLPKQMNEEDVLLEIEKLKKDGINTFPLLMKNMVEVTKGKYPSKDLVLLIKGNL